MFWVYPLLSGCVFLSNAQQKSVFYGDISINDTVVSENIKIIGSGHLSHTTFQDNVSVVGLLEASNNLFEKDLYVVGSNVTLENDHVQGDLHVTNYLSVPHVQLSSSVISGRIVFHGLKPGVVMADDQSTVASGVENGEQK